jgi:DNA-binding CsgD family transcriptional regulator
MPERAIQLVELGVGTDPTTYDRWGILEPFAHAALSVAQRARGDDAAAVDTMLRTGQLDAPTGLRSTAVADWRHTASELAARTGRGDEVRAVAAESLELAQRFGADRALGMALHVDALLRDDDARIDGLLRAAERHERAGARWELARVLGDVAALHASADRIVDARAAASRALELATASGARPFAVRMQALVQRLGGGVRHGGSEPRTRAILTPGELRVAELAASGLTNREIAQALFVTVKAVEWHLSNTYRKLGIGGRRELAGVLDTGRR